jgi:hypothetical protein
MHPCTIWDMFFGLLQRTTSWVTAGDPVVQSTLLLGPLYTKSLGLCSTQVKHSYWCKSWNQPQGLYTRSQGWTRNNLFNLPKVTNKCWTLWPCIGPKAGKRIPSNLAVWFATLRANVSAFINILTSMF